MIDPIIAVLLAFGICIGGSLGRRPISVGGLLGGDGSHGTSMTVSITDNVDPAMTLESIVYTIVVTNTGAGNLSGLSVAFTIDANSTYVSSTAGGFDSVSQSGGVVTATRSSGPAGSGTSTFTVTVTAPATAQTLTASVSATASNASTATDSETTVILLVSSDATSGWYFPANATEWGNVGSCCGFTVTPFVAWDCQAASGNFSDLIGAFTSSNGGLNYHQTATGFARYAVTLDDATTDHARNLDAGLPDIAFESCFWMWVGGFPGSHGAADMQMNIVGSNPTAGCLSRLASTDNLSVQFTSSGSPTVVLNSAGSTIRPLGVQVDRTNSKNRGITDGGIAEPTWQSGLSGKSLWLGSGTSPDMSALYAVGFRGAHAEFTRTQIKTLWTRLRWGTVTWTP